MRRRSVWLTGLLAVLLLGAAVRAPAAFNRPLWFDEADTWRSASAQVGIGYRQFFTWTNHFENAPLGYLLARVSMDVTGSAVPWAMRLPALLAGLACVAAAFVLGRVAVNEKVGLLAALLVAVDPNMVDQSQQCRMYAMLSLFMLLATAWAIVLLRDPRKGWWHWAGLGALLGLCLCSTLLGVIVWVGLALGVGAVLVGGWIMRQPHRRPWGVVVGFTAAYCVAAAVAAVGVYRVLHNLLVAPRRPNTMPLGDILREIVTAAKDLIAPEHAGLLVYPLALVGLVLLARRCRTSFVVLTGLALAGVLLMLPFRRQHHLMDPRYLFAIQPALWMGLGMLGSAGSQRATATQGAASADPVEREKTGLTESGSGLKPQASSLKPLAPARRALWIAGASALAAYALFQAWQCLHIERWWQQPDKYLFAVAMQHVRDARAAGEAVIVDPPVADILAQYYGLPLDARLKPAFEDNYHQRPDAQVPADFDAPAVWLVIGMVNDAAALDPGRRRHVRRPLEALASHYGLTLAEADYRRHVAKDVVSVARLDARGITWKTWWPPTRRTAGPASASPPSQP